MVIAMDRLFDVPDDIPAKKPRVTDESIRIVFDYWVTRHHTRGPKPQLSSLRRRRIHDAIRNYDTDTCFHAIDGCLKSPWHMGDNPRGQKYNDISLILRSAEKIEKFASLADDDDAATEFLRDA